MARRVALNICGFGVAVAATSCSVTYQSIYENDVRFEHCYRLDEERTVPIDQKRACWQAWSRSHTYGQSRDRMEYARARDRALYDAQATGMRPLPGMNAGVPACPMPTSAFAPPPSTLAPDAGAAVPAQASALIARPADKDAGVAAPGARCGDTCGHDWK